MQLPTYKTSCSTAQCLVRDFQHAVDYRPSLTMHKALSATLCVVAQCGAHSSRLRRLYLQVRLGPQHTDYDAVVRCPCCYRTTTPRGLWFGARTEPAVQRDQRWSRALSSSSEVFRRESSLCLAEETVTAWHYFGHDPK